MPSKDDFIKSEGHTFPGKTYVDHLLRPVFNDQRDYLFKQMFNIHRAHVVMLAEQGILDKKEAAIILQGVETVSQTDPKTLQYDPQFEDLFFMMEHKISEQIGPDLAGKMHIARSRNDMGVAMYRLVLRERILTLLQSSLLLSDALLEKIEEHAETIITAYTHTQPAQPTTLAHYLTAVLDVFLRDVHRLWSAYETVNRSPMGAAALSTTGFPINRKRVCELLGFRELVENSYDAIAGADYLTESATAVLSMMINSGGWIQDFLQLVTREYNIIKVADPYVQISSIMPQKRNPVSIEHSRSLASSSVGEALAAIQMIHNTPFGDIVDTEDDLQPHLYRSYEKANRVIHLMHAVIRTMEVNKERALEQAKNSCITITELADVLAREKQVPFRTAHQVASSIAKKCSLKKLELHELSLQTVNEEIGKTCKVSLSQEEWDNIISPIEFVKRRNIQGGPNPEEIRRSSENRKKSISQLELQLKNEKNKLLLAEQKLINAIKKVRD
ncbi:argininosuccinate lyase [Fictibacillus phosphorivorans]|uniref:argininosuccinate lyase n=1 Tax=Fictibacillus phosphorivorans TaxID=1221500 RepID=UPI00203E1D53|nr:argininosuccinate lyase [Fictibacillus phosphorivorans]MCM3718553.1 argininosuccinate lyase [Fictibacillus phosphorivorans]MCM3776091.1 argininosuccinate lyase [Fictibacillus phosphorivorans]